MTDDLSDVDVDLNAASEKAILELGDALADYLAALDKHLKMPAAA